MNKYKDAQQFVDFTAYLVARGVGRSTTSGHISTARKLLEFLEAQEHWNHTENLHKCLDRWICLLPILWSLNLIICHAVCVTLILHSTVMSCMIPGLSCGYIEYQYCMRMGPAIIHVNICDGTHTYM